MQEKENFRRNFIGNLAHELKTPLFTSQSYLLTLIDGALKDDKVNLKYLKIAEKIICRDFLSFLYSGRLHIRQWAFTLMMGTNFDQWTTWQCLVALNGRLPQDEAQFQQVVEHMRRYGHMVERNDGQQGRYMTTGIGFTNPTSQTAGMDSGGVILHQALQRHWGSAGRTPGSAGPRCEA